MSWKARPTMYKGIQMRSRLEAKFAAYLDLIGQGWVYEPRAYADETGQYLPDFQLEGDPPAFVEVKPTADAAEACLERMQIIFASEPSALLAVVVANEPTVWTSSGRHREWATDVEFPGWPS